MTFSIGPALERLRNNAIIRKYLIAQMRPGNRLVAIVGYCCAVVLIGLFNLTALYSRLHYSQAPIDLHLLFRNTHITIVAFQFLLYYVFGLNNVAVSIVAEKEEHTYEFFKTLPVTYRDAVIGKLIGPNILLHLLQLITVPLALLTALLGNVPVWELLALYAVLICVGFFLSALGLFSSLIVSQRSLANVVIVAVILLTLWMPAMTAHRNSLDFVSLLSPVTLFTRFFGQPVDRSLVISFFELPTPIFLYPCLIYTLAGIVLLTGIFRKFRDEDATPFSRRRLPLFFLVFAVLLAGFMRDAFRPAADEPLAVLGAYFLMTWGVVALTALAMTPARPAFLRWLRAIRRQGTGAVVRSFLLNDDSPALVSALGNFLITVLIGLGMLAYLGWVQALTPDAFPRTMTGAAVLLSYLLCYLMATQYISLFPRRKDNPALGSFLLAVLVLPPLFAAFSSSEFPLFFNPITAVYVSHAFSGGDPIEWTMLLPSLAAAWLFFGLFAYLTWEAVRRMYRKTVQPDGDTGRGASG